MGRKIFTDMNGNSERLTESFRRTGAAVLQWGGWGTGLGIWLYAIINYNPAGGRFAPQWVGLSFIVALFVGVAGTLVRSRMRLADTILGAFQAGMAVAREKDAKHHEEIMDELAAAACAATEAAEEARTAAAAALVAVAATTEEEKS